jgi:hypothetical protein
MLEWKRNEKGEILFEETLRPGAIFQRLWSDSAIMIRMLMLD